MFVTAVYAVLDPQTGEFTYANAGHNPPIWIRRQGGVEKLSRTMIALGLLGAPLVTQRSITLDPGDSVLMYTDGLTEAFSPEGDLFGEALLLESITRAAAPSAEALIQTVQADLLAFVRGEALSDDLTMLALRRQ
jgi:sigma-B regulation protein RsbU (phosphoserine phosphatase)